MGTPDHLGAFWRPASLLPWKLGMWAPNWQRILQPGRFPVSHLPTPAMNWMFSIPTPMADGEIRREFLWDGTYPD